MIYNKKSKNPVNTLPTSGEEDEQGPIGVAEMGGGQVRTEVSLFLFDLSKLLMLALLHMRDFYSYRRNHNLRARFK